MILGEILNKAQVIKEFEKLYGENWPYPLARDINMTTGNIGKIFQNPKAFTYFQALAFTHIIQAKKQCLSNAEGVVLSSQLKSNTQRMTNKENNLQSHSAA